METLQRTANRGSISTGYDIDNSLKVESANSEYFIRTFSSAGTQTTGTVSFWIKRTSLGTFQREVDCSNTSGNSSGIFFESDQLCLDFGGSGRHSLRSEAKLRDTSAWYHCMAVWDTTQSTDTERTKIYINGSRVTIFSTATYPSQNATSQFFTPNDGSGSGNNCLFSRHNSANLGQHTPNGYHAEFHYIDGTAKTPSDFGEFDEDSGIWIPKAYTGSHGSNGFYLDFADASDLGDDESGNGNDWTETNITAADQATDTPTNNFCTLVGDQQYVPSKSTTLVREGGTIMHGGQNPGAYSTMGVRSGKWYFESTLLHLGGVGAENHGFGVIAADRLYDMNIAGEDIGADVGGWACAGNANPRNNNSGASGANYLTAPGINVVLGCALDMDNGKIWWHNAGTWHSLNSTVGNPANGTSPAWSNLLTATDDFVLPAAGLYANGAGPERAMNFGGYALAVFTAVGTYSDANGHGSFSYAPPSGYYALCTKNLEEYG